MTDPTRMPPELATLFSADGDGPAQPIDADAAAALVTRALSGAQAAATPSARVLPMRRKYAKRGFVLLAAAVVFVGSAAAMYSALQGRPAPSQGAERTKAHRVSAPPAANDDHAQLDAPAPTAEPSSAPAATGAADAEPTHAGGRPPQDLLPRANRLRGEGDYAGAERTYLRVVSQAPGSPAAYSARVAAASLRLERLGDARGALALYGQALRAVPDGPLGPEIREGIAAAYRKLGNRSAERGALQALLAADPSPASADKARARLKELSSAK